MQLANMKYALAAVYIAAIGGVGFASGITSLTGWIVLGTVGLAPAVVLAKLWKPPTQTMSDSIRSALR